MERLRTKIQIAFAAIFNIGIFQWHTVCFPVLNCHSCPISIFACPLGVIGQFSAMGVFPLTVIGGIALAGILAGRFLCGWACPFGFFQDLVHKIPYLRFNIPEWTKYIKYGVFALLVVAVPMVFSPSFPLYFCRLCPVATVESAIPWAVINGTTDLGTLSIRLGILFTIIVMCMGHRRFFCKVICPLGACLSLFNRIALVFPSRTPDCIDCGKCNRVCIMEPSKERKSFGVYDHSAEECITCLECKKKCPTEAITLWG